MERWRAGGMACALAVLASACTLMPSADFPGQPGGMLPVLTEHSQGLACLGALIEEARLPPVIVAIAEIEDETVPTRFEDRRLSRGGAWWLHTAVGKLGTARVRSTHDKRSALPKDARLLELSGAFTQDDRIARGLLAGLSAELGRAEFGLGLSRRYDVIAGDFTSSVGGRVVFASAIAMLVPVNEAEARLVIDDGGDRAAFSLGAGVAAGPQFAQRRITEAAALVHLARHFEIDYRPCLARAAGDPLAFSDALAAFERMTPGERSAAFKQALAAAGFDPGTQGPSFDRKAARALMAYQSARGIPPTGRPAAILYAMLLAETPPR